MTAENKPTVEQVLGMMRKAMGAVPSAIEKASQLDEGILHEHLRSKGYAMPAEGALDEQTRTLVYLSAALAAGSQACVRAMANKARGQGIAQEKLLETLRIARLAAASKVLADAEPLFDALLNR